MSGPSPDANMQGKRGLSKIQEDTSMKLAYKKSNTRIGVAHLNISNSLFSLFSTWGY